MVNSRKRRKVILRDIAEATGYSINTVSHALKDKSDISLNTKQLIQNKAKEMGYIADSIAGSLRSGVSKTIAVVLGDMSNPHFGLWVREIEKLAFDCGYSTLIFNTDENENVETEALKTAVGKRVDGIILCPTQKNSNNLLLLKSFDIPFVLIGRRYNDDVNYVVADDTQGGIIATRLLFNKGYKNILLLNGPAHISSAVERYNGYCIAHKERGLECKDELVRNVGVKSGQCKEVLFNFLNQKIEFDAVVAFSDLIALEAMTVFKKTNYHNIPIIGFDGILSGISLPVSLSSIVPEDGSLAPCAFNVLIHLIDSNEARQKTSRPIQIIKSVRILSL